MAWRERTGCRPCCARRPHAAVRTARTKKNRRRAYEFSQTVDTVYWPRVGQFKSPDAGYPRRSQHEEIFPDIGVIQRPAFVNSAVTREGNNVKIIWAVIRPHRLQEVKEALADIGVVGMTVTDVRGAGRQKGQVERYRGSEYSIDLLAKIKVEVAVLDSQCEEVVQTIRKSGYSGEIGDGKIFVLTLEDAMRIRTGERGDDSL